MFRRFPESQARVHQQAIAGAQLGREPVKRARQVAMDRGEAVEELADAAGALTRLPLGRGHHLLDHGARQALALIVLVAGFVLERRVRGVEVVT